MTDIVELQNAIPSQIMPLGAFIKDKHNPLDAYHVPPIIITRNNTRVSPGAKSRDGTGPSPILHSIPLTTSLENCTYTVIRHTVATGKQYRLVSAVNYLKKVLVASPTKRWIEINGLRHEPIYLLVGMQTTPGPNAVASPRINRRFTLASGDQIWALEYRQLEFRQSSRRNSLDVLPSATFDVFEPDDGGSEVIVQEKIEHTIYKQPEISVEKSEQLSTIRDLPRYTDDQFSEYSTEAVADELAAAGRARLQRQRNRIVTLVEKIEKLAQLKSRYPEVRINEGDIYKLKDGAHAIACPERLTSKHDEDLSKIDSCIGTIAAASLISITNRQFHNGLLEAQGALGVIKDTLAVSFIVDLSDFYSRRHVPVDSYITITSLSGAAFANTAACYVSWRWGENGMRILHWLPKIRENPILCIKDNLSFGRICIELRGELKHKPTATSDKYQVSIRVKWMEGRLQDYYALVADVALELAWILAAFKGGPDRGLSYSTAEIPSNPPENNASSDFHIIQYDAKDENFEDEHRCWRQLFTGHNVAVRFPVPPRPKGARGIEMPYSLMTKLVGVGGSSPIPYGPGFVLRGPKGELLPICSYQNPGDIAETKALQWHLHSESESREHKYLPMHHDNSAKFLEMIQKRRRHFLGLYQHAEVLVGTERSRNFMVSSAADQRDVIRYRQGLLQWNRTFSGGFGGGFFGAASLATGAYVRTEDERQLWHLTHHRDFNQHLELTRKKIAILYDVQVRTGWMLPQIHVIMHLIQAWIRTEYPAAGIKYPVPWTGMDIKSVRKAMDEFTQQPGGENINLEATFVQFSHILEELEGNNNLEADVPILGPVRLHGVDFEQISKMPLQYSILRIQLRTEYHGNWAKVLKRNWEDYLNDDPFPYKIVPFFCSNINPRPIWALRPPNPCEIWDPPPKGKDYLVTTLHCIQELAESYGTDPLKLSPDHFWVQGANGPFEPCAGYGTERLQMIKTNSIRLPKALRKELGSASDYAAIIFGGKSDDTKNCHCLLQVQTSPPETPEAPNLASPILTEPISFFEA
ncbi:hypothetical protein MHUMG1_05052 [Metarhizium humberi]|uniref:Uncharacterized protein n=1 Tax=Metarhizium humberi TaxID=2596975 RepID=A0A9P8MCX1_9HYPO|nr:hypothetical protein MHUMG1_05052 [Metarhizium humberi]